MPDVEVEPAGPPAAGGALTQLAGLAALRASGELVCSFSGGEVHVFLQEGRIAWASSTRHRRAFSEHLKRLAGVSDEVIEAIVAECSRTHRPLGEALIAWKIATAEQVRAALLHQVRAALGSVLEADDARTLFLERAQYRRYDSALTFPLTLALSSAPADPAAAPPGAHAVPGAGPHDVPDATPHALPDLGRHPVAGAGPEARSHAGLEAVLEAVLHGTPQAAPAARAAPPPAPPPAPEALLAVAGDAAAGPPDPAATLAGTEGLAAAAVLSARGDPLAVVGDRGRIAKLVALAPRLLQDGQRLAIDVGAGLCHQLHVETDDGHLLLYSARSAPPAPGAAPGALHRFVLVLRDLRHVALARERADALAAGLEGGRLEPA